MICAADISFEFIKTEAQFDRLRIFASTFKIPHVIDDLKHPFVAVKKQGKWIGYFQIVNTPVIFSAWHDNEEVCSPRDIIEANKQIAGWSRIQYGEGLTTVDENLESKFSEEIMKKLGFYSLGVKLYCIEG